MVDSKVAQESMNTQLVVPRPLAAMLPTVPPAPGIYLAMGARVLPSWFLSALAPALAQGTEIFWIDGASPYDALGLSHTARVLGYDPVEVLEQVHLARAFNLWQLEIMVCKNLPLRWNGQPVVIADPLSFFYDEDVPAGEAHGVMRRVVDGMRRLPAVWIVLEVDKAAPSGREGIRRELARPATSTVRLEPAADRYQLARARG